MEKRCYLHCGFIHIAAVAAVFCILFAIRAEAKYTPVGIPATASYVKKNDKRQVIIYVGDSRAMRMTISNANAKVRYNFAFAFVTGGNVTVIDKNGKLTPYVEKLIKTYKKRKPIIIFNLGVNGNGNAKSNAKRIIRIYRGWMKKYPKLRFVVESVNPTLISSGSYSNKKVIKLNRLLKAEFDPDGIWMDTYSVMWEKNMISEDGYGMADNLHYKWSTSKKLLKYIRKWVNNNIA